MATIRVGWGDGRSEEYTVTSTIAGKVIYSEDAFTTIVENCAKQISSSLKLLEEK